MKPLLTRCVAVLVAMVLAMPTAAAHTFPPVRTVVVQVERCELAVLVGFRPGSGEATDSLLRRIASSPKSQMAPSAKSLMTAQAIGPLTFAIDSKPLVPTGVRAKLGVDPGGTRPLVVVLVTFAIPTGGGALAVTSKEPRTTRISWTDRESDRADLVNAPAQARWFTGVASFLLPLVGLQGVPACASSTISSH
jgi:hypothetical protein